jgi:polyphosphate kinase
MYYDRDLSWLGFNEKVLQQAACQTTPLMERIKFLAIFSSNLDEFFRVRFPAATALDILNKKTRNKLHHTHNLQSQLQQKINNQLHFFGDVLSRHILPALLQSNIHLYYNEPVNTLHEEEIKEVFFSKVLSFIQPLIINTASAEKVFPENGQLYFIVSLAKTGDDVLRHALVNIPSAQFQRFIELSPVNGVKQIIFIDDVIRYNINCIFPGFEVKGVYSFKLNRDAELSFEDDFSNDVLNKIEKQLQKRNYGTPSRFLFEPQMPSSLRNFMASYFDIADEEMYEGGRYHNLKDFARLPVTEKHLLYPAQQPVQAIQTDNCGDIFEIIKQRDILLHFPYHSFNPVLSFFNQCAIDPGVEEIFIALYRVAEQSHIVNALISAARNGKKVTAFVELKARFDEENNIRWSRLMKYAGVNIIYSMPGIKVHSKIALVVKKEKGRKTLYSLISTGNFNETTARFYTDHTLLTTNRNIGEDLAAVFNFLKKRQALPITYKPTFNYLLVSQFNMVKKLQEYIEAEMQKAQQGLPACIRIKVNNLEEPLMIEQLYKASKAGVTVQLLVRGICCLVPGVEALSENITIKRIVDRYLEHSRILIFGEDETAAIYIGSADMMTRNLYRRIEVYTPVLNDELRKQLITYFNMQWSDNDKATILTPAMENSTAASMANTNAQQNIYNYLSLYS